MWTRVLYQYSTISEATEWTPDLFAPLQTFFFTLLHERRHMSSLVTIMFTISQFFSQSFNNYPAFLYGENTRTSL